MRCKHTYRTW